LASDKVHFRFKFINFLIFLF